MIGVGDILDILKITVWSGGLKGERPLSIILIASVGGGKSSMIRKTHQKGVVAKTSVLGDDGIKIGETEIRHVKGSVLYTTNTSPYILYTRYGQALKSGTIRHIAIPDFLNILNLPKYSVSSVLNFYNSLIEEGLMTIESRSGAFLSEIPIVVGLITSIAKQDFGKEDVTERWERWGAEGFLSRALPVSFSYGKGTAAKIRGSVKKKEYLRELESFDIVLPEKRVEVGIPMVLANVIENVAVATKDLNDELGARRQKQLQVFCMANALMNGRDEVAKEDVQKLLDYEKYFNYHCSAEI